MANFKWYKRDANAALTGMMCLNLEERGAYNTILDLLYTNGGKVVDDDRFLAGWMRCDIRVWKRIKKTLFDHKKLYTIEGFIRNRVTDKAIDDALHRGLSASEAGHSSARKRNAEFNKNKDIGSTGVQRPFEPYKNKERKEVSTKDSKLSSAADAPRNLVDNLPDDTPIDFKKIIFNEGLRFMKKATGKNEDALRRLFGKWCRDFGDPPTATAIMQAQQFSAVDPIGYIEEFLKGKKYETTKRDSTGGAKPSKSQRFKDALVSGLNAELEAEGVPGST